MLPTLLSHGWKKLSRSISFEREMVTTVLLGLFVVIMAGYAIALGYAIVPIITKTLSEDDPINFLNGFLLYYFVVEFVLRYFMQNLPVLDIQPYLHLPVKRNYLVHFFLGKSVVHFLNIIVFFLFTPFALKVVANMYGFAIAINWLVAIWFFSLVIHFLVVLFKKKLDDTFLGLLIIVGLFSFLGAADYFGWFKLSEVSRKLFSINTKSYFPLVIGLLLLAVTYWLNVRFFLLSMYPEEIGTQKRPDSRASYGFSFLQNFGVVGELVNLEVKLILRNKRPRTLLLLSIFLLLYGLMFYRGSTKEKIPDVLLFGIGIFMTGAFSINYGQFLFSWQGGHFDFTNTRPFSMRHYLESKYWLLSAVIFICFLLTIPYVYFGWRILIVNGAMMLFNMGVNVYIIMNIGLWDPQKINLSKGSAFNWEGVGAAQWLMALPLVLSPFVIYLPFSLSGYPNVGIFSLAMVGLAGIILHPYLLNRTAKRLLDKKYTIAAGFRKD